MALFLFQNKKDSQAWVGTWSSDRPEQLTLVVYVVIGALVSGSLSHIWGLWLRWHFQFSGFPFTYVIDGLHQNTRTLLFLHDLMLMRQGSGTQGSQKGLLELWVCTTPT